MKLLTPFVLCLLAGLAQAGTFELSDPAADMQKEWAERDQRAAAMAGEEAPEATPAPESVPAPATVRDRNVLCTVDLETGSCTCIDTKAATQLPLTREECAARISQSLQIH